MSEAAGGTGTAFDPAVVVTETETLARLTGEAKAREDRLTALDEADASLKAAKAKVERARFHLKGAEKALAAAEKARKAVA